MSYKLIEAKGKDGLKVCQHYKPENTEEPPSCGNCKDVDGEIQTLDGVVTAVACKLRNNRTPEQIEALKVARQIPNKKINRIGHHQKKTEEQGEVFNPDRLSKEELNKANLNLLHPQRSGE